MPSYELHPDYSEKSAQWLYDKIAWIQSDDCPDALGTRAWEIEMSCVCELKRRGLPLVNPKKVTR